MPAGGWGSGGMGSLAGAWGAPGNLGAFGGAGQAGDVIGQALMQAKKSARGGRHLAGGGLPADPAAMGAAGAQGYPGSPSGPGLPGGGTDPYLSRAPTFRRMGAPTEMPQQGRQGAQMGAAARIATELPDVVLLRETLRRMTGGPNPFEIERRPQAGQMAPRGSYGAPAMHGTDTPVRQTSYSPPGPYDYKEGFMDSAIDRATEEPMETIDDIIQGLTSAKMSAQVPHVLRQLPTVDFETAEKMRGATDPADQIDRGNESDKRAREILGRRSAEEQLEWARANRQIPMSEKRGGKVRYTKVKAHKRRIGGKVKEALNVAKRRKEA